MGQSQRKGALAPRKWGSHRGKEPLPPENGAVTEERSPCPQKKKRYHSTQLNITEPVDP